MPNMNEVVITVYVESPSIARPLSGSNPDKNVKANPVSVRPQRRRGYDRRAQLLSYTQQLRTADNKEQTQWNVKRSRQKSKWKCLTTPKRLGISFLGIFRKTKRRWRYRRMPSEEDNKRNNRGGKKKKHGRIKFWKKMKRMFGRFSFVWQRKKG